MIKPWILKEQDLSRTFEIWLWVSQIEFYSPFGNLTFQGRAVKLLGRRLPTQLNHFYTRSNHPVRQWLGCTITSFPKYLGSITHSQFRWARIPRDKMFDESWWGEIPLFFSPHPQGHDFPHVPRIKSQHEYCQCEDFLGNKKNMHAAYRIIHPECIKQHESHPYYTRSCKIFWSDDVIPLFKTINGIQSWMYQRLQLVWFYYFIPSKKDQKSWFWSGIDRA